MIAPEPALVLSDDERDCTLYVVPAAGHLGVIEEECADLAHDPVHGILAPWQPCPDCKAVV